jgi:hypothetical protein
MLQACKGPCNLIAIEVINILWDQGDVSQL